MNRISNRLNWLKNFYVKKSLPVVLILIGAIAMSLRAFGVSGPLILLAIVLFYLLILFALPEKTFKRYSNYANKQEPISGKKTALIVVITLVVLAVLYGFLVIYAKNSDNSPAKPFSPGYYKKD